MNFFIFTLFSTISALTFNEWKFIHQKNYSENENILRQQIWENNLKIVENHNNAFRRNEVSFTLEMNHLAAHFEHEYKGLLNYFPKNNIISFSELTSTRQLSDLPDTVDWNAKGAVTPPKDQGQCGSCWSFSATGAMESAHFLATGKLLSFSEQQLINCVHNGACDCNAGGLMEWAFDYVVGSGGIVLETTEPYTASSGKCSVDKSQIVATFSSYKNITMNNELELQAAVAQQPVSIAIDASSIFFQLYSSGVYDPLFGCCTNCNPSNLDHGVLAAGYGTLNGKDYWLVKNSWGGSWGQKGYLMMVRNKGSKCGVATEASYPIV